MYNEDHKTEFIKQLTDNIKSAKTISMLFDSIEPLEEELHKDIWQMSTEELSAVINQSSGIRTSTKRHWMTIIGQYLQWCSASKHLNVVCEIDKIELSGAEKIRCQMVSDPKSMRQLLDNVFDPEGIQTIDLVYRGFLWLLYMGISSKNVMLISPECIDLKHMVITIDDEEHDIYPESLTCLRSLMSLTSFSYIHPLYNSTILRPRVQGDSILRGIKSHLSPVVLGSVVSKKMNSASSEKRTATSLTPARASLSGVFYRTYCMELSKIPPDFKRVAAEIVADDEKRYENVDPDIAIKRQSQRVRRIRRDLENDYYLWKTAFYN